MFFSPRIGLRDLASLCRRMAISLEAGVDARRVMQREAHGRTRGSLRHHLVEMSHALERGESLSSAMQAAGDYFPTLTREMVTLGEVTGHTAEVLQQLANHYEGELRLRKSFLASITWPMIQLCAALAIVGLMILVMGWLPRDAQGKPLDLLGLGLVGSEGLFKYVCALALVVLVLWYVYQAARRGKLWIGPVQSLLLKVPKVGRAIETLALARLSWSLSLTTGAGMDVMRALPLGLRSMNSAYYSRRLETILGVLRHGQPIHEALAEAGVFPADFLDAIEVGEQSGRLSETLALLSRQYDEESQRAIGVLSAVAGFLVWALVAGLIILLIFRLFSFYLGAINEAAKW